MFLRQRKAAGLRKNAKEKTAASILCSELCFDFIKTILSSSHWFLSRQPIKCYKNPRNKNNPCK